MRRPVVIVLSASLLVVLLAVAANRYLPELASGRAERESERGDAALLSESENAALALTPPSEPVDPARTPSDVPSRAWVTVVEEGTRRPIADATIEARSADGAPGDARVVVRTDAAGRAELGDPAVGRWHLRIAAEGYFPLGTTIDGGPDATCELAPAGELLVRVVREDGSPAPSAYVVVQPQDPESRVPSPGSTPEIWLPARIPSHGVGGFRADDPVTDASGEVRLGPLPCGRALVVTATEAVPKTRAIASIPVSSRTGSVEIRVPESACLRGRFVYEDGEPAQPFVRYLPADDSTTRPIGCPPDGTFFLCGLPLGWVRWRVELPGEPIRANELTSGDLDVGTIVLPRPHLLEGRVFLDDAPSDITYESLRLALFRDGKVLDDVALPQDGRFSRPIPPGEARLQILRPEGVLFDEAIQIPSDPLEIAIDPYVGEMLLRNAPVPPRPGERGQRSTFHLWLLRADAPAEASATYIGGQEYGYGLAWTDEGLLLRLVRTGTYELFLAGRGAGREYLGRVTVQAGTRSILDCDLPRAKVTGTLVDLRGEPIEGGRISAALLLIETVQPSSARSVVSTTDEDGRFQLDGLCPGTWSVFPEISGPHGSAAIRVDLAPGVEQEVVLRTGSPTRVAGRVTRQGKSVDDASLVLSSSASIRNSRNSEAKTDDRGSFAFDGVFPGEYELSAYVTLEADESYRRRRHITVEDGHPLEVDFEIESPETIVTFFRQGKPFDELAGAWVFTSAGESGARSVPRQRNALALELEAGPCLFLVFSDRLPWPEGTPFSSCCYAAYVPAIAPNPSALNVDIAGAEVSVRLGDGGIELPLARLTGIGPIEHPWGTGSEPFVAFEDVGPGARRFVDVPIGARLRLESRAGAAGPISLELDVDRSLLELSWPPP